MRDRALSRVVRSVRQLGSSRNEWVAAAVPEGSHRILDIGCAYGWALNALGDRTEELWGVDIDEVALRDAAAEYPHLNLQRASATDLPFASGTFDVVILAEVIEHVGDENKRRVIDEAHRVLRPGGVLLFTAPYAGLSAAIDPLDIKRRLPRLYGIYARLARHEPATRAHIGHKHVSLHEIESLFAGRFAIEEIRYCGLLMPMLTYMLTLGARLHILSKRLEDSLNRFRAWESGVRYGHRLSFNVRIVARKRDRTCTTAHRRMTTWW